MKWLNRELVTTPLQPGTVTITHEIVDGKPVKVVSGLVGHMLADFIAMVTFDYGGARFDVPPNTDLTSSMWMDSLVTRKTFETLNEIHISLNRLRAYGTVSIFQNILTVDVGGQQMRLNLGAIDEFTKG